jgi:hypothetical protein
MKNTMTTLTLLAVASFLASTAANAVFVSCNGGTSATLANGVYTCTTNGTPKATACKYGAPSTASNWTTVGTGKKCTPGTGNSCNTSC